MPHEEGYQEQPYTHLYKQTCKNYLVPEVLEPIFSPAQMRPTRESRFGILVTTWNQPT
jgi:hypothetical protein